MSAPRRRDDPAGLLVLGTAAALSFLHLAGLGASPLGLAGDEAATAYNAWCLGHHGVDAQGAGFPLFPASSGGQGLLLTYLLTPVMLVASPASLWVRLPSALAGIAVILVAAWLAQRLSGSRGVGLLTMVSAGLMPWLFLAGRVATDTILVVLCVLIFAALLATARPGSLRACSAAGVALAAATFTDPSARLLVAPLALLAVLSHGRQQGRRGIAVLLIPVAVSLAVFGVWLGRHSAAPGLGPTVAAGLTPSAVMANYLHFFSPDFLLSHGDPSLRISTGYGGLLLITTVPVLLAGLVTCLLRIAEPLSRLTLGGLLLGPLPAALAEPVSAARAAAAVPFLILLLAIGWGQLWPLLRERRRLVLVAGAVGGIVAGGYLIDAVFFYPQRAAQAFDAGEQDAIVRAHQLAGGHRVILAAGLDDPLAEAEIGLLPACDANQAAALNLVPAAAGPVTIRPGDILVVASQVDGVPAGATLLFSESVTANPSTYYPDHHPAGTVAVIDVYRV